MDNEFKIEYLNKSGILTVTNVIADSVFAAKKAVAKKSDFDMHITCEQISENSDDFD